MKRSHNYKYNQVFFKYENSIFYFQAIKLKADEMENLLGKYVIKTDTKNRKRTKAPDCILKVQSKAIYFRSR